MKFVQALQVNEAMARAALGYGKVLPDEKTAQGLSSAAKEIDSAAMPRAVAAQFACKQAENGVQVGETQLVLQGADIAAHLAGCAHCYLLCLSLGAGVDALIRKAQVNDMTRAVLLDVCASALIEQYADEAEDMLRAQSVEKGMFVTGRFSPGYGDLPINVQPLFMQVMNTQRLIGLTVSEGGIMLPRKSISAVLGVAKKPVTGRLAGCDNCTLKEKCPNRNKESACGAKNNI